MPGALLLVALALLLPPAPAGAESFETWSIKAEKARKRGESAEALEAYGNALRAWTKRDGRGRRAQALSARGRLHAELGNTERALEDIDGAIELDKKNPRLFHLRGRLLMKSGRTAEAITEFYKATKLDLRLRDAYFDRAEAYASQGDQAFAREDYGIACRLGHKKACAVIKPPRPKARRARRPEPARPRPRRTAGGGLELDRTPAPLGYKLDFPACISAVEDCVADGRAFGDCVRDAEVCESNPGRGCCPRACVVSFHRLTDAHGRSEAAAFREVFSPENPCARGLAGRPASRGEAPARAEAAQETSPPPGEAGPQ